MLAGYSAVRRISGCSISAPLTLLQIPAWKFFFSSLGMGIKYMERILSKGLSEEVCFYRSHQKKIEQMVIECLYLSLGIL